MSASVSNRRLDEEEEEGPESSGPPAKRLKSSASTEEGSKPGRVEKFSRSEESVGITEYLSPDHVGFQGLLKQRYCHTLPFLANPDAHARTNAPNNLFVVIVHLLAMMFPKACLLYVYSGICSL